MGRCDVINKQKLNYKGAYNIMYDKNIQNIIEAQNGNEEAMENLVKENNGLIWSIVKRFKDRGYELEDLYQLGCMGFIKCIHKFDTNLEYKLSTYAVPYILGEIKRFLRDDGPIKVSRSTKELLIKIKEIQRIYLNKEGKELSVKEIAEELNVETEEVVYALTTSRPLESINEEVYEENDRTTLIDKISLNTDEESKVVDKIVLQNILNSLSKEEKDIIILRYFREQTQTQVAKLLGISQVQVSRIEKKILGNLRAKFA